MYTNNYNGRRKWSDKYIPNIKKILKETFKLDNIEIGITDDKIDKEEAADLYLKNNSSEARIALRLRKKQYARKYPYDFTIRYSYKKGYKTEYEKILEGNADFMFYGFVNDNDIFRWIFLDLDVLRREIGEPYIKYEQMPNKDNINDFRGYDIRSFKYNGLILAHSEFYFDAKEISIPTKNSKSKIYILKELI